MEKDEEMCPTSDQHQLSSAQHPSSSRHGIGQRRIFSGPFRGRSVPFQPQRIFRKSKPIPIPSPRPQPDSVIVHKGSPSRVTRRSFGRRGPISSRHEYRNLRQSHEDVNEEADNPSIATDSPEASGIAQGCPAVESVTSSPSRLHHLDDGQNKLSSQEVTPVKLHTSTKKDYRSISRNKSSKGALVKHSLKKSEERESPPKSNKNSISTNGQVSHLPQDKKFGDKKKDPKHKKTKKPSESEQKDCPLCLEPLDADECNLYPCSSCKFQICLFCLNRLREEASSPPADKVKSDKALFGLCPGCRNPYPSDDEWKVIVNEANQSSPEQKKPPQRVTKKVSPDKGIQNNLVTKGRNRLEGRKTTPPIELPNEVSTPSKKKELTRSKDERFRREFLRKRTRDSVSKEQNSTDSSRPPNSSLNASKASVANTTSGIIPSVKGRDSSSSATNVENGSENNISSSTVKSDDSKQQLVCLLSQLGLNPSNIHFQRPE